MRVYVCVHACVCVHVCVHACVCVHVYDLAIIPPKIPLCPYKKLITETYTIMRAFTIPLFHTLKIQVLTSLSFIFESQKNLECS